MAQHSDSLWHLFGSILRRRLLLDVRYLWRRDVQVCPSELSDQTCQTLGHLLAAHGPEVPWMKDLLADVGQKGNQDRVVRKGNEDLFDEPTVLS